MREHVKLLDFASQRGMLHRIHAIFFFNDVFLTISIDSAGSVLSQIPSVWCQFSPSVRWVPKNFFGWTPRTQTWKRQQPLSYSYYSVIVPLQKQRDDLGKYDFLGLHILWRKCRDVFSSVAMILTVNISFLYQTMKHNLLVPWTPLRLIRLGKLRRQTL